jgi:protein phosphatase
MLWFRKRRASSASAGTTFQTAAALEPVACMLTDAGCHRELNEDYARIIRQQGDGPGARGLLAIVADGMGGHQAGEVASRTAVETIAQEYASNPGAPGTSLQNAFQEAHRTILKLAKTSPEMEGMGTTCTALAIAGQQAWAAHVGDSRLYLAREGEIYQLSEDHTQCMEMVRRGLLTLEDAKRHADRNVLTHAMGTHEKLTLMTWPESMPVRPRDVFVLCSDGLHDLVPDAEIKRMVWDVEPSIACKNLVQTARDRGGYDNITVIVIAVPSGIERAAALKETGQYEACI